MLHRFTLLFSTLAGIQLADVASGQSTTICTAEADVFNACIGAVSGVPSSCESCVATYLPSSDTITDCTDFDDAFCTALTLCDCTGCQAEFLQYINCQAQSIYSCTIFCSYLDDDIVAPVYPSVGPPVAPPPTVTGPDCDTEITIWANCMAANGLDEKMCVDCVSLYITSDTISCSEFADATCLGLDSCGPTYCDPCSSSLLDISNCLVGDRCETFDCLASTPTIAPIDMIATPPTYPPSPSPSQPTPAEAASTLFPTTSPTTAAQCPEEGAALDNCLDANGLDSCLSCLTSYWPSNITSCSDFDDETCTAVKECSCDPCVPYVLTFVTCLSFDSCLPLQCPLASAAPSITPVIEECRSTYDAVEDCFYAEISASQRNDCVACMSKSTNAVLGDSTGQNSSSIGSCESINQQICQALSTECVSSCGSCLDEQRSYLECQIDATSIGCQLDCPTDDPPTTAPFPSPATQPTAVIEGASISVGSSGVAMIDCRTVSSLLISLWMTVVPVWWISL